MHSASTLLALGWAAVATAHGDHGKTQKILGPHQSLWYNTLPGDGGTQVSPSLRFLGVYRDLHVLTPCRPTRSSPASRPLAVSPTSRVSRIPMPFTTLPSSVSLLFECLCVRHAADHIHQAPLSTLARRTARAPVSAPRASARVLAVLISSMSHSVR
jgi:hypothetical protein